MMPSSIVLYRIANPVQGTHSNLRCVCFHAWNEQDRSREGPVFFQLLEIERKTCHSNSEVLELSCYFRGIPCSKIVFKKITGGYDEND